jgi:hypothetical protein
MRQVTTLRMAKNAQTAIPTTTSPPVAAKARKPSALRDSRVVYGSDNLEPLSASASVPPTIDSRPAL